MNKHILALIICVLIIESMVPLAHASQTFTVPPGSKQTISLNLGQNDLVNGTISVSGGTGTGVNFIVSDPNGKELLSYNYTSTAVFSFSASINGTYVMSFDNSFCSCVGGKTVTLDYSINSKPVNSNSQAESDSSVPVGISALIIFCVVLAISVVIVLMRHIGTNATKPKHNF